MDDILADKELSAAAHWDDKDLTRDGVFARAWDSMIKYASHWRVDTNKLEEATAEIANAAGKSWLHSPLRAESLLTTNQPILPAVPSTPPNKSSLVSNPLRISSCIP